jgi:hypothetical protein
MAAPVESAGKFSLGGPRLLFSTGFHGHVVERRYAVTGDGRRFLLSVPRDGDQTSSTTTFHVLLDWQGVPAR